MTQEPEAFEINTPTVVSEVIDGEAVMINLDTGAYYSMNETGSRIWAALRERLGVEPLIDLVAAGTTAGRAAVADAVRAFLDRLAGENLIRPCAAAAVSAAGEAAPGAASFVPPALEKYRDLEDLLLADPIHDVSEAGWPHQKGR